MMPTGNSRLKRPYDQKLAYRHTAKMRAEDRKRRRLLAKRRWKAGKAAT